MVENSTVAWPLPTHPWWWRVRALAESSRRSWLPCRRRCCRRWCGRPTRRTTAWTAAPLRGRPRPTRCRRGTAQSDLVDWLAAPDAPPARAPPPSPTGAARGWRRASHLCAWAAARRGAAGGTRRERAGGGHRAVQDGADADAAAEAAAGDRAVAVGVWSAASHGQARVARRLLARQTAGAMGRLGELADAAATVR